jgi:hypothetical protein
VRDLGVATGCGGPIVVEHTVVESYPDQVHDNKRTNEVFRGFADRFGHSLESPGTYTLTVVTQGGRLFPKSNRSGHLDQLESWIRAQHLPTPEIPPRTANHVRGMPPEVPVPVVLYRMQCLLDDDGALKVVFTRPEDLEVQRASRIAKALADKAPKLAAARQHGGVTLLALESRDYIMANPWSIARSIHRMAQGRSDLPDFIKLVDTTSGSDQWIAYTVKTPEGWTQTALGTPSEGNALDEFVRGLVRRLGRPQDGPERGQRS